MNKIDRVILLSMLLILFTSLATMGFVYFYWFDTNPAVVISNVPFPVDRQVYHSGEPIIATIDYCRYTDVEFEAYNSFVNEIVYALPTFTASGADQGCHIIRAQLVVVPQHLPSGRYKLIGRNVYRVNPIAKRVVEWETVEFEVLNGQDSE